jgi:hypothetical protein
VESWFADRKGDRNIRRHWFNRHAIQQAEAEWYNESEFESSDAIVDDTRPVISIAMNTDEPEEVEESLPQTIEQETTEPECMRMDSDPDEGFEGDDEGGTNTTTTNAGSNVESASIESERQYEEDDI